MTARAEISCDSDHVYRIGDRNVPGVNEVINSYLPPSQFYTDSGREMGIARHRWYSFLSEGNEP